MHARTPFFQRLLNRMLLSSSVAHSERTSLMRRYCSDRLCLLMTALLVFYIIWNTFNSPNRSIQYEHDPIEELAYIKAMNTSSPMLENTQICSLDKIDLLFLIISSTAHFLERQSIRETWGSMPDLFGVHSQRLFVIGYHMNGNFYKDVSNEAAHERDILYLTVNDHLPTLKEMHAYRWLDQHCSNVIYMFKTEDDLFVNSLLLHELVRELKTKPNDVQNRNLNNVRLDALFTAQTAEHRNQFFYGWAFQAGLPERNATSSPYYVSKEEYAEEMYPRYCSGFGYLMTSETRRALTTEAFKDKNPFRFPDVFMAGILPQRLKFVCDLIPFTFHQGTIEECAGLIKKSNTKAAVATSSPLLVCSTGRHMGQNAFADYYKLWTDLKNVYADRLRPTND